MKKGATKKKGRQTERHPDGCRKQEEFIMSTGKPQSTAHALQDITLHVSVWKHVLYCGAGIHVHSRYTTGFNSCFIQLHRDSGLAAVRSHKITYVTELIQTQEGTQNKLECIHCRALQLNRIKQKTEIIRAVITKPFYTHFTEIPLGRILKTRRMVKSSSKS